MLLNTLKEEDIEIEMLFDGGRFERERERFNTHPSNGLELLLSKHKPSPNRGSGRDRTCTASWQAVHRHKRMGKLILN